MTPLLKTKLASWVEQGLISKEQAAAITAHESQPERPWTLYGIAGIGVTALVTGVISLVAANWHEIPDWLKLSCYFMLQGGVGYGFYRKAQQSGLARETLLTVFASLLLAGIGLIAQIYNLHGDGWQALFLWLTITAPSLWLARSWMFVHLWTAALLITSCIWAESAASSRLPEFGRVCVVASVPPLLIAIGNFGAKYRSLNTYVTTGALTWGLTVTLVVATPLANVLWNESMTPIGNDLAYVILPWLVLFLACFSFWQRAGVNAELRTSVIGVLLSAGFFLTLPLVVEGRSDSVVSALTGAAGFFCTWAFAAAAAAYFQHKRWFDVASLVMAVRVVVVYFEVFGSLAMTGLGLILSGLVILGIAFAWHRFRGQVRRQLGGEA